MHNPESYPGPNDREVFEDDWAILQGEGTLFTQGISTCIGIAICSVPKQLGALGHLNGVSLHNGTFDSMMEAVHNKISDECEVSKIWLGGAEVLDEDGDYEGYTPDAIKMANEISEDFKNKVLDGIKPYFRSCIDFRTDWLRTTGTIGYSLLVHDGEEEVTILNY